MDARKARFFPIVCILMILGLLIAGCAPATSPASVTQQPPPSTQGTTPREPAAPAYTPKPVAGQPKTGGTLIVAKRLVIPHFDMHQEITVNMQAPLAPCYSWLIQNDPIGDENKIIGDLARSWDISPDGLAYTFKLNDGVKFHDSTPLTSEDVKASLDRIIFPPKGVVSPRQALYAAVEKIETVDPPTVKISLKRIQGSLLQLLALQHNFIFPAHILKEKGDMKKDVVGTGPFKFVSEMRGVSFKSQRNPDYFVKGLPYLDGVIYYDITDERSRIAALRTGQVLLLPPWVEPSGPQVAELLKQEPKFVAKDVIQSASLALILNERAKPWDDIRVRRAISLAVDREAVAKVVRGGFYPAYGYVVPKTPWTLPDEELKALPGFRQPKDLDIAGAKRLLAEAGYPNGFKTTVIAAPTMANQEASEALQHELAKIGIDATIRIVEQTVLNDFMIKGQFEAGIQSESPVHTDPDVVLGAPYLTGSTSNFAAWSNPKFDELYVAQSTTLDMAKRVEIVREMQRIIYQNAPKTSLTWALRWAVWAPEVKNWKPGTSPYYNHKMDLVWLDK